MANAEMIVTLRAVDKVTPVIKRIQRRLWWSRHGEAVLVGLATLVVFLLGEIVGRLA